MGVPQFIIHFRLGISIINQPFLGTPILGNLQIEKQITTMKFQNHHHQILAYRRELYLMFPMILLRDACDINQQTGWCCTPAVKYARSINQNHASG